MRQIILASKSPRRKILLKKLGVKFKVVKSGYREHHLKHLSPSELVKFLAFGKAKKTALKYPNAIIIAADTVVEFKGDILGKPKGNNEAKKVLQMLSGKTNYVITGMAVVDSLANKIFTIAKKTKVEFKKLSLESIEKYILTGEPMDRAGAYALDGKGIGLVRRVVGDMDSAIGLPIKDLKKILQKIKHHQNVTAVKF